MLWLGVLLWASSGLAQEAVTAEEPEPSAEEQAQREEVERLRGACAEAYRRGQYDAALTDCGTVRDLLELLVGSEHPDYAQNVSQLAVLHALTGEQEQALDLYRQAQSMQCSAPGQEHPDCASTLSSMAGLLESMGSYEEALQLHQQAREILVSTLGEDHPELALVLNNLATNYLNRGRTEEALPLYERALQLLRGAFGEEHDGYIMSLRNLAILYLSTGRPEEALPLYQRAVELGERVLGESHPDYARSLEGLAIVFEALGLYEESLPLLQRAAELLRTVSGEEHPDYAKTLRRLAGLHMSMAAYEEALALHQRAVDIRRSALGAEDPSLAVSLYELATVYQATARYSEALPLYQEAAEIHRRAERTAHPDYAATLNGLASLYRAMGSYEQALALYQESLLLYEAAYGEGHPEYAAALNNLAGTHLSLGSLELARPLYVQAVETLREAYGEEHPSFATGLNNLAHFYQEAGEHERALTLHQQALQVRQSALGELHPAVAASLNNLASLYHAFGQHELALSLYQQVLEIERELLGPDHPSLAQSLSNLGILLESMGDQDQALRALHESLDMAELNLSRHLRLGNPKQKLAYLETMSGSSHNLYRMALQRRIEDPDTAALALETLLRRKGRALAAEADTLTHIRQTLDEEGHAQLSALRSLNSQIDQLAKTPPAEAAERAVWTEELSTLQDQQERLQEALATRSLAAHRARESVTLQGVQARLPAGAGLLEWVQWVFEETSGYGTPRYAVFLLTAEGLVVWRDLGEAAVIDTQIDQLRRDIQREGTLGFEAWGTGSKKSASRLYETLLAPLEEHLAPLEQLFISPDGELSLLPFDSLMDAEGQPLAARVLVTNLTSGRDLLRLDEHPTSQTAPALLAGVDFGEPTRSWPGSSALASQAGRSIQGRVYTPLQGTRAEGEFLHKLLWRSRLYTGTEATEARLKSMAPPSVLHIATHGYFLPAEEPDDARTEGTRGSTSSASSLTSPLLRSGLVLAGANSGGQEDENGFLSAAELINMDLRGTELVVLSACETGIGEVQIGEGVQGLSKALQVAGSETQVLSLWKVSDEATQILMQEFYTLLIDGVGRGEALRQAKTALREDPRFGHPFYWSAFVLSGDWRPLDAELGRPSVWERWRERRSEG